MRPHFLESIRLGKTTNVIFFLGNRWGQTLPVGVQGAEWGQGYRGGEALFGLVAPHATEGWAKPEAHLQDGDHRLPQKI